jgi:hypothetical protein
VLSEKDKEKLVAPLDDNDDDDEPVVKEEVKEEPNEEPKEEVKEEVVKQVEVEDAPKKKRIVKKKSDE